jgi:hypothetical protein
MEESEMNTSSDDGTLRYRFDHREDAEHACAQIRDAVPACIPRLGVTADYYVVTVTDLAPDWTAAARAILVDLGGEAAEFPEGTAPRRSQPGFSDAAPGIVPEATDFSAEAIVDYEDAGGRFAQQLDRAPDKPRSDRG